MIKDARFLRRRACSTGVVLGAALLVAGCTTSPKVQVNTSADGSMSCARLADEQGALDQTERQIRANKGVTGKNVLGVLFWLPGYVYSQNDADEALRLVAERRKRLSSLQSKRNCS